MTIISSSSLRLLFPALLTFILSASFAGAQTGLPPHPQQAKEQTSDPMEISVSAEEAERGFVAFASRIDDQPVLELPIQHGGRLKPLDTYAREAMLYVSGGRSRWGLSSVQMYLALPVFDKSSDLQLIEIRDARLREEMGLPKARRYFSVNEIDKLGIASRAQELQRKEQENRRSITEREKNILEVYNQLNLAQGLLSGEHFLSAVDFSFLNNRHGEGGKPEAATLQAAKAYLTSLANEGPQSRELAAQLVASARAQEVPPLFAPYLGKLGIEVLYNHARPFAWAAALYLLVSLVLLVPRLRTKLTGPLVIGLYALPIALHIAGFAIRVYITGFAPVTNMYGTMVWVSLGVALFSGVLLYLYRNYLLVGLLLVGSALILLLTESFPLVLSPDLDPIVAVLRSNYWLTIHVLTITISYAAFTICMLIGNFALLREFRFPNQREFITGAAHAVYRMIQLGVFLLTAGIILGGIWADYSWGRFWGWDPKETWALIADMGFLVILHARYIGWLSDFGTLAASTVAYLLVVMAWYGVNFVLAAGLHSYGFSSGGALMVVSFVSAQAILLAASLFWHWRKTTALA